MKDLLFIFALGLSVAACHHASVEDNDPVEVGAYVVSITVNKPTANSTVTKGNFMPIDVAFKRNGDSIIHNILLEIVDNKNAVVQTILEQHAHVKGTFNFSDVSAFKPTTAGSFKFRATTTDDDKLQPNTKEILFTVN